MSPISRRQFLIAAGALPLPRQPIREELKLSGGSVVTRRRLLLAGTLLPVWAALAQGKVARIGVLETVRIEGNANFEAFRQALRDLGYVEQKNLAFEYRYSDGRNERFAQLATELVRLKVDLILTRGTPASLAAKAASRSIPIVTTAASDPVRSGLVASLARPGGNVTGFEPRASELAGKRAELLREILPGVTRVGYLVDMSNPVNSAISKELVEPARSRGLEIHVLDARKAADLAPAFEAAVKQRLGGIIVGIDGLMSANREAIVQLAARHRLPAIYASSDFAKAGGMLSYAVDYRALYIRAATYVDRILKGTKPGDLPVEQASKLELVVNLNAAKALGVAIPASVRLRADNVIE